MALHWPRLLTTFWLPPAECPTSRASASRIRPAKLDLKGVPEYDAMTAQCMNANGRTDKSNPIFMAGDAGNFIPLLHEAATKVASPGKMPHVSRSASR